MELGTALVVIAVLYLLVYHRGFRLVAALAATIAAIMFYNAHRPQLQTAAPVYFTSPVPCAGLGARNVPGDSCCPLDYLWDEQRQSCRQRTVNDNVNLYGRSEAIR